MGKEFLMPSLGFDLDIVGVFDAQNIRPDIRSNTAVEDAAILSMVEHRTAWSWRAAWKNAFVLSRSFGAGSGRKETLHR